MIMSVPNPPLFIGRKTLVGIPQQSKFGGSKAKFGEDWDWDIANWHPP
jgi:hypothetical protein